MPAVEGGSPGATDDGPRDSLPRHANWLELFFDLVMVAFVGQLALGLHGEPGPGEFLAFAVLFFPAWWAWVNITLTLNLFGEQVTGRVWFMMGIVMLAVGLMAAAVAGGLGERTWAYAIGNALMRVVLFVVWWVQGRQQGVPWYRPVVYCGLTAVLWAVSAFTPPPTRYVLWAAAIAIEIVLLAFMGHEVGWLRRALNIDHLSERVGLFVVIVFGESVLAVIIELSSHWTPLSALTALLAFASITMLAWAFFTYGAVAAERGWHRLESAGNLTALRDTVMYLPFLLVTSIVLLAAGLGTAVAEPAHPLSLGTGIAIAGGIALFYATNAAVMLRYGEPVRDISRWAIVGVVLPVCLLLGTINLDGVYVVAGATVTIGVMGTIAALARRRRPALDVREGRLGP